ncbi:MAG: hypothetical protein MRY59_13180 [Aquisalinus sp.]|nr:hypothetical protein [Aquisalinus sp.]
MQINVSDGNIRLSSIYKLFFVGALISSIVLFLTFLLVGVVASLITGEWVVLIQLLPMIILWPGVLLLGAAIGSLLNLLGIWLYRFFRPVVIVVQE